MVLTLPPLFFKEFPMSILDPIKQEFYCLKRKRYDQEFYCLKKKEICYLASY